MLEQLILISHMLVAVAVIGLILLQQGKGADMGASFGSGASQTVFGVQGGGNMLTRWTAILATVFFLTSLSLGYYAKQKSEVVDTFTPAVEETVGAEAADNGEIPVEAKAAEAVPAAETEIPAAQAETPADAAAPANAAGDEIPQ